MMTKHSKRYQKVAEDVDADARLAVRDAVDKLKSLGSVKFDETVEIAVRLGIDPKKSDQSVRGSVSLPHGTGKKVRVIAFAEGEAADAAEKAGAIEVGGADLAKKITDGWMDFDVAVAHPSMMKHVGKLGKILGPHGKMPSPKSGTVTENAGRAVTEFIGGKIEYRNDSGGNVHVPVGKKSFEGPALTENIEAFLEHLEGLKPSGTKGIFIRKAHLSSTMGPGIQLAV